MGIVTAEVDHEHWSGLLAMDAVGQLDEVDLAGLRAHVAGCAQCQTDRPELCGVVDALALVDGSTMGDAVAPIGQSDPEVRPATLDAAVLTMLAGVDRRRWTHRRQLAWAAAAVAAGVIVVIGVLGFLHQAPPGSRTVALRGHGGNHATAVLVPEAWGTTIQLSDQGDPASRDLTVSMRTEYGSQWVAGSYRSIRGGNLKVTLACALPIQQIDSISVTDGSGRTVLHS